MNRANPRWAAALVEIPCLWSSCHSYMSTYASCLRWASNSAILAGEFKGMFKEFLAKYPRELKDIKRIGIAFSGGPDSLALTHLLHQLLGPERLVALTVNHKLPGFGEEPVDQIAALLEPLKIEHQIIHLDWPKNVCIVSRDGKPPSASASSSQQGGYIKAGKLHQLARNKRYEAFLSLCGQLDIPLLLTAHHFDDDLVTFLYRFARMSGLDGMAGMKPYTTLPSMEELKLKHPVFIGRPLLGIPKSRLIDTCAEAGLSPVQDPSNDHLGHMRNSIREALVAMQKNSPEMASERLLSMLKRLKEYRAESQAQLKKIVKTCVVFEGMDIRQDRRAEHRAAPSEDVSPGDVLLVFPPSGHWWFSNPYLTTRLFLLLTQYISNHTNLSRSYTLFSYVFTLCQVLKTRAKKDERTQRNAIKLSNIKSFMSDSNENESNDTGPPSVELLKKRNVYVGVTDPTDPCRRIYQIRTFNTSGCQMYPFGGRDTHKRLSLCPAHVKNKVDLGPGILFCRAAPSRHLISNYYLDINMKPDVLYLWDERMFISFSCNVTARRTQASEPNVPLVRLPPVTLFKLPKAADDDQAQDGASFHERNKDVKRAEKSPSLHLFTNLKGITPSLHKQRANKMPPYYLPDSTKGHTAPPEPSSDGDIQFRITFLSLDALKYLARLAFAEKTPESAAFMHALEKFRSATPSPLLYHHPLFIDRSTLKRFALPTIGLELKLKSDASLDDLTWSSKTAGQDHLFNRVFSPP